MLPSAVISHQTSNRVRIKITSRKGDVDYFSNLSSGLEKEFDFKSIQSNALTGSILIQSPDLDLDAIAAYVSLKGICQLTNECIII
jgi:hypothetical protein